eukprot:8519268-Pyramimonas_sp.AAC.1
MPACDPYELPVAAPYELPLTVCVCVRVFQETYELPVMVCVIAFVVQDPYELPVTVCVCVSQDPYELPVKRCVRVPQDPHEDDDDDDEDEGGKGWRSATNQPRHTSRRGREQSRDWALLQFQAVVPEPVTPRVTEDFQASIVVRHVRHPLAVKIHCTGAT